MVPLGGTLPSAVADRSQHIPRAWAKDQGEYADGVTERWRTGFELLRGMRERRLGIGQYRTGDFVMKKLLLATTAFVVLAVWSSRAAGLWAGDKAPPPPPPPPTRACLYLGV